MNPINYTFIIPTKNIPNLLQRCLDSIPKREDIQIIVVDDNSDPEIVDFNNYPGMNDDCVEILFTKEGKGAGYARNKGLEKARGKWILFADSDDFYAPDFISVLDYYKEQELDILFFNIKAVKNDTHEPAERAVKLDDYIKAYDPDNRLSVDNLKYKIRAPWYKMYSKAFIDKFDLRFAEVPKGNDMFFTFCASYFSRMIAVEKSHLYITVQRDDSLTFQRKQPVINLITTLSNTQKRNRFFSFIGYPEWKESIIKILVYFFLKYKPITFLKFGITYFSKRKSINKNQFIEEIELRQL